MKIKLPWKRKGHDDRMYWAKLEIDYGTFQMEVEWKRWRELAAEKEYQHTTARFKKRKQSGLKKCPGHEFGSNYDEEGKCNICGAWK